MHALADKVYATLTPTQRASAFVSALARKDFTESRRLKETAPVYSYRTHDLMFFHAMDRGLVLATIAGSAMERAMITGLSALLAVGQEVIADLQAPNIPYDGKPGDAMIALYIACERTIRMTWAAYAEAATLAGFDPQELLLLNPLSANV